MRYATLEDFKQHLPHYKDAFHCVCISEYGEIHQCFMAGEHFQQEIGRLMIEYTYINGWYVYAHEIKVV